MTQKKKGMPAHKPTDALRERVVQGKGFRETNENIARALGINIKTLKKYYSDELEQGEYKTLNIIRNAAMQQVMEGNTAVIIFLLKALGGLSDRGDEVNRAQITELPRVQVEIINKSDKDIKV